MMVLAQSPAVVSRAASLRSIVLARTGQDVGRCCSCELCEQLTDGDVHLSLVMQWVRVNDERALMDATVWSDEVLRQADRACANQLDIPAVLQALRSEAIRRGLR